MISLRLWRGAQPGDAPSRAPEALGHSLRLFLADLPGRPVRSGRLVVLFLHHLHNVTVALHDLLVVFPFVRKEALAAVLDPVCTPGEVASAGAAKDIERAVAEKAVEIVRVCSGMAGKVLACPVGKIGILCLLPGKSCHGQKPWYEWTDERMDGSMDGWTKEMKERPDREAEDKGLFSQRERYRPEIGENTLPIRGFRQEALFHRAPALSKAPRNDETLQGKLAACAQDPSYPTECVLAVSVTRQQAAAFGKASDFFPKEGRRTLRGRHGKIFLCPCLVTILSVIRKKIFHEDLSTTCFNSRHVFFARLHWRVAPP